MTACGAVTGFTRDVDLGEGRFEAVVRGYVGLVQVGRVTLGAHVVPVLGGSGPVQHVVVGDLLVGIEVEPALPAFVGRAGVPGQA